MKKIITILFLISCFTNYAQTQVVIGPQSSTFSSMTRGYHFTSPTAFNLCALYIPQDASAGTVQSIWVVRFNTAAPPAFPGTTNAYTTLFTTTGVAANTTVSCNIPIAAGDIIGIYGSRAAGCINSYDGVNFAATINGFPTTLSRSGTQNCINGVGAPAFPIWSEVNFSIGRIFMYYNCCPTPTITTAPSATNICSAAGTSVTILGGGATTYTWMPGNINTSSISVNPTVSTTYTLTGATAGCSGSKTVAVNVSATPTINTISNTGPVCQGAAVNFNANATTAGVASYSWTGPNGFNSNVQNPAIPNSQPINSGTYSLTVTNTFTDGLQCKAFSTTTVGIVPTGTINTTPTFTLCQGATLNLVSNALPAPTSYSWTGPNLFSSTQQNPVINTVMPASAGAYNVTAYYTSPATTLVCTATGASNVQVVATAPTNVTANPNNLCQYANTSISANAPGAVAFSWTGPNNFASTSQVNAINNIQPASAGVYNAISTFAIGSVSCTTSGSAQINVVSVNPVIVTSTVATCEPGNAQLSASSSGAVSYLWTGPNNYTSSLASPVLTAPSVSNSGIYLVTTSYNNGALTCYNSNTVQLTVYPKLTFTIEAYKQTCYNTQLTVNGPPGGTSYAWTSSSGFTSNTQNLNIPSIQPNQAGTFTLTVSLGPCVTSQKIQIDVLTPLALTLTPQDRTICRGDSVMLVAGATGGSQNYAYVWNPPAFLGSPTGSLQYGLPLGTTIYNLTAYDIACPNYTVQHTFTVKVNQPPVPDLQLEKAEGCEPLCLFYNTKTQNQAAITTFNFGGSQIMQTDSFFYCLTEPGTYNLKISSLGKNGCKGVYDFPVPIVVWPKPHSDFSWNPEVITTSDNQVTFDPTSKYGPITSINWMFSGTGISGYDTSNLRNPQRTFETIGKYPIMLIQRTDHGCVDSIIKIIDVIDDMNVFIPNSFTPNGDGNNDIFNIKGLGIKLEGYSMELFDRWGHSMYFTKDVSKGWDGTVKGQPAQDGVYIYKIRAIGVNGEGKKEYIGHVTLMK
jgi:gliding motility-associated-like protein